MKIKHILFFSFIIIISSCNSTDKDNNDETLVTRDDYLGTWNVAESCTNYDDSYSMSVMRGSASNEIIMTHFHGYDWHVVATVNGNQFTIPQQSFNISGSQALVSGSGSLVNDNTMTMSFVIGGFDNECTATASK